MSKQNVEINSYKTTTALISTWCIEPTANKPFLHLSHQNGYFRYLINQYIMIVYLISQSP